MSGDGTDSTVVRVALLVTAVAILAYSVLVATSLLLGVIAVALLFVVYLAQRFVRAVERIADGMDAGNR